MLLGLRPLFSINYLITYIFPSLPFNVMIRTEYLALFLAVQVAALYFLQYLQGPSSVWVI